MKILPFPGKQRMLCQRDGLRLQSERGRKEEMKRFFGGCSLQLTLREGG